MNTNEIHVITFPILGVPGFKTAYVTGVNPKNHILSELTGIHCTLKKMVEDDREATALKASLELCKELITNDKFYLHIPFIDIVVVETISSNEFLKRASSLCGGNIKLFCEHTEEMINELLNHRRQRRALQNELSKKIEIPDCFLITCSGGIFATQPNFPVLISSGAISLAGGDAVAVVREICSKHLAGVKGSCLIEMVNNKNEQSLNTIKEAILKIDELYGMLGDITVVNHGTMLNSLPLAMITKTAIDERADAVRYFEHCSSTRLHSFINSITVDLKDSGVITTD